MNRFILLNHYVLLQLEPPQFLAFTVLLQLFPDPPPSDVLISQRKTCFPPLSCTLLTGYPTSEKITIVLLTAAQKDAAFSAPKFQNLHRKTPEMILLEARIVF